MKVNEVEKCMEICGYTLVQVKYENKEVPDEVTTIIGTAPIEIPKEELGEKESNKRVTLLHWEGNGICFCQCCGRRRKEFDLPLASAREKLKLEK